MRFAERMTMSACVMWSRLLLQDAAETGLILFFFSNLGLYNLAREIFIVEGKKGRFNKDRSVKRVKSSLQKRCVMR